MKVLFIAYYFDPFPGVGAKRVSYWANNIHSYYTNDSSFKATVVTATQQINTIEQSRLDVHYVPDVGGGCLFSIFKTDKGASWMRNLKAFLKDHLLRNQYDTAIITGGPFLHFFIIKYLKSKGIKVVLDFRDPFATNPRALATSGLILWCKRKVLKLMELYFISMANKVITVNKYCVKLLASSNQKLDKFVIIDNGYDERFFHTLEVSSKPMNNRLKFVYAGTIYTDPSIFLDEIVKSENFSFDHIGTQSKFLSSFDENRVKVLGVMSYSDTVVKMMDYDVCMIFTSGSPFESTTKIFDYIALNKMIWIITDGVIRTGAIYEITKDYPNIVWCENNHKDIRALLNRFARGLEVKEVSNKHIYSRKYGLNKLKELLENIK